MRAHVAKTYLEPSPSCDSTPRTYSRALQLRFFEPYAVAHVGRSIYASLEHRKYDIGLFLSPVRRGARKSCEMTTTASACNSHVSLHTNWFEAPF